MEKREEFFVYQVLKTRESSRNVIKILGARLTQNLKVYAEKNLQELKNILATKSGKMDLIRLNDEINELEEVLTAIAVNHKQHKAA